MLFMLIVKASSISESEGSPSAELVEAMSRYNEELEEAGVRVMAKGLRPSSEGIRLTYEKEGEKPVVSNGPFSDPGNIVSGFILIDVASKEEAVEWAVRMPDPIGQGEGQVELRQLYE